MLKTLVTWVGETMLEIKVHQAETATAAVFSTKQKGKKIIVAGVSPNIRLTFG